MKTKNAATKQTTQNSRMLPRKGMTLAVVLLVMLVGTVLVGMSLYMAENLHTTTQMFVARGVEYNTSEKAGSWMRRSSLSRISETSSRDR